MESPSSKLDTLRPSSRTAKYRPLKTGNFGSRIMGPDSWIFEVLGGSAKTYEYL
jgi:hypothetical protein